MNRSKRKITMYALLFFLVGFASEVTAQERKIVSGKIVSDSLMDKSGVHVINMTAEKGTVTNENGEFDMMLKLGDSIYFSSVQFENEFKVIGEQQLKNGWTKLLYPKMNELAEVQLDNIKLSGVLDQDITRMPKSIYEKLGIPFPKPRRTSLELAMQANTNDPVSQVINMLNGTTKQLKKAEENAELTKLVNRARGRMQEAYFVNGLGLPENEVVNFLYYCVDFPTFEALLDETTIFALMEFFEEKLPEFKSRRQLE
ncbi:hypothetical protein [uncultured Christiangramia sp.]|uniref:hypothetical protein n=1 Tax=Christiangramia sp. 3-2217-3z TaxID=3417564 RepID=UPI00262BE310|nr:hypothetical protein [uncultured Christiangramia sp.]